MQKIYNLPFSFFAHFLPFSISKLYLRIFRSKRYDFPDFCLFFSIKKPCFRSDKKYVNIIYHKKSFDRSLKHSKRGFCFCTHCTIYERFFLHRKSPKGAKKEGVQSPEKKERKPPCYACRAVSASIFLFPSKSCLHEPRTALRLLPTPNQAAVFLIGTEHTSCGQKCVRCHSGRKLQLLRKGIAASGTVLASGQAIHIKIRLRKRVLGTSLHSRGICVGGK